MKYARKCLIFCSLILTCIPLLPQKKRLTVERFLEIPILSSPKISPNGKKIIYHEIKRSIKKNKYKRSLFLFDLEKRTHKKLTSNTWNDWGGFFSKDGKSIYFISDRGGTPALYKNNFDGADPIVVFRRREGFSSPKFSPNERYIAFLAPPKGKKGRGKDPEIWKNLEDKSRWPGLWIKDLKTAKEKFLTGYGIFVYDFSWAPNSKSIAFTGDKKGSSEVTEDHFLGLVDLDGNIEVLSDQPAHHARPKFSPDGKYLAFIRDRYVKFGCYVNVQDLFLVDIEKRKFVDLTPSADFDLVSANWFEWSQDGKWIYFLAGKNAKVRLYKISSSGGIPKIVGELDHASIFYPSFDKSCTKVVFCASSFTQPLDVFISHLDKWEPKRITNNYINVEEFNLSSPIKLKWRSRDNFNIEGFLFLPKTKEKGKKYPLVVEIHGGPCACWLEAFSYRYLWHLFAEEGWATLLPNIRGSTTYGEKFLRANLKDFGGGDFADVVSGVNCAVQTGYIDKDKLAISGYSYGGFMVNMAVTKTNMFKAAVSIAGGFNFLSCFLQANPVLPEIYYDPLKSKKNLIKAFKDSPIYSVFNVTTPLLLMHGKEDRAVHPSQSIEYFNALKLLGKEVKLILYPGEGHGINRPSHMVHYINSEIDWIKKHFK